MNLRGHAENDGPGRTASHGRQRGGARREKRAQKPRTRSPRPRAREEGDDEDTGGNVAKSIVAFDGRKEEMSIGDCRNATHRDGRAQSVTAKERGRGEERDAQGKEGVGRFPLRSVVGSDAAVSVTKDGEASVNVKGKDSGGCKKTRAAEDARSGGGRGKGGSRARGEPHAESS